MCVWGRWEKREGEKDGEGKEQSLYLEGGKGGLGRGWRDRVGAGSGEGGQGAGQKTTFFDLQGRKEVK